MIKPPCKKDGVHCDKRQPGCHALCPDFHAFEEAKRKEREAIMKKKKEDRDFEVVRARSARLIQNATKAIIARNTKD